MVKKLKVLNCYAGIGGNRALWADCEVTAVENQPYIAETYQKLFPQDKIVIGDAHQYLLDHFQEYDFIWSSPPCPTHSKLRLSHINPEVDEMLYPDMTLYQEIIFLKHFFKGNWVVENVESYYNPLIFPNVVLDRHFFWSNFHIDPYVIPKGEKDVSRATKEILSETLGIVLPEGTKDQRKLLRNAVNPQLGLHIFNSQPRQETLI